MAKRALFTEGGIVTAFEVVPDGHWEIAFNESHLRQKLNNGDMAEIIMPEKPWFVRLWIWLFPLRELSKQSVESDVWLPNINQSDVQRRGGG